MSKPWTAYALNAVISNLTIQRQFKRETAHTTAYEVQCNHCGYVFTIRHSQLRRRVNAGVTRCFECREHLDQPHKGARKEQLTTQKTMMWAAPAMLRDDGQ